MIQITGRASQPATGITQARSVRAPTTTIAAASAIRGMSRSVRPGDASRNANQSVQADGDRTNDTAVIASVVPTAIANARHWARTRNHSAPRPGVILVSTGNAHATGPRRATTNAAASRKWMLPTHSS